MSRNQVDTRVHANLRVSARVYDVRVGAFFSKNIFFGTTHRVGWTPRLRSPSLIMVPAVTLKKVTAFNVFPTKRLVLPAQSHDHTLIYVK